jgi:tetratricopeptide (TPR) repeat protein
MNKLLTTILILFSLASLGQKMQVSPLEEEAKTNKRLLPRYGLLPKTESEIAADKDFVRETMKQAQFNGDYKAASGHLIKLGFDYLYKRDLRTAMYRFNQAYLLDSTNTDIYWGYGAFYMTLGNYEEGKKQYTQGLSINPNNTHLLTDYGTYFLSQYYGLKGAGYEKDDVMTNLDTAIMFLNKSFNINKNDPSTTTKLSICYWLKGDCEKAWDFYDKSKELGGQQLTEEYTADLKKKCKRRK